MDCTDIVRVREKLQDEKSKKIFDARFKYMIDGDAFQFFNTVTLLYNFINDAPVS